MEPFLSGLLVDATILLPLAVFAWYGGRWGRCPALSHAIWVLVLVKLLTPPLLSVAVVVDAARWPTVAAALPVARAVPADQAPWPGIMIYSRAAIERMSTLRRGETLGFRSSPVEALRAPWRAYAGLFANASWRGFSSTTPAGWWEWGGRLLCGYLLLIWLLGSLIAAAVWHARLMLLREVVAAAGPGDRQLTRRAARLAGTPVARVPPVVLVSAPISPALVGWGRGTRILFPRALWECLPDAQRDTLLLHELAHFRRGDHWVRGLEACVTILFWWHPLVWIARAQLRWTEELCCDAAAVKGAAGQSRTYAEALLATLDFLHEAGPPRLPRLATGIRPVHALQFRLRQIMSRSVSSGLGRWSRLAIVGLALTALPIDPWLMGSQQQAGGGNPSKAEPAVTRPAGRLWEGGVAALQRMP